MRDKDVEYMLSMLKESFDVIHITTINYERAASIDELKQIACKINLNVLVEDNPFEFVEKFDKEDKKSVLVVLGSMYLLGEIKSRIAHK
jgi:folylpolyglutamate synthase/dihydropteroate synthase